MAKATLDSITINAQKLIGSRTVQVCDFTSQNTKGVPVTKAHLRVANDQNETVVSLKLNKDTVSFLSTVKNITDGDSLCDTIADNEEMNSIFSRFRDIKGKSHGESYLIHCKDLVSFVEEEYEGDGRDTASLSRKASIQFAAKASGKNKEYTREEAIQAFALAYTEAAHAEMVKMDRNEEGYVTLRKVEKADPKAEVKAPVIVSKITAKPKEAPEAPEAPAKPKGKK